MKYRTRKLVKPSDLNPRRTLFGGQVLKWIDEEVLGDIIEFGMDMVKVGTSSITIACDVRNKITKQSIVRIDKIVFVLLDENGKPKPHGKPKLDKDEVQ